MQEHAVPVGHLVFPILLPLAQRALLQQAVCLDDKLRCCCLEAHTAFDADDGVANVAVAANGVRSANLLNLLYGGNLVVKLLAVNSHNLALLKRDLKLCLLILGGDVLEISFLGQTLGGVENLATADAGAPDAHVVRIFQFGKVGKETVLVQVVDLLFTRESLVACEGYDLYAGSHHQEGHVETYLVVAGTR